MYKIGDSVKVVKYPSPEYIGKTGIVDYIYEGSRLPYDVILDNGIFVVVGEDEIQYV